MIYKEKKTQRIDYLIDKKIIFKQDPTEEQREGSTQYDWGLHYPEGTYNFFNLFQNGKLIFNRNNLFNTLRAIKYLNWQLEDDEFKEVCSFIADPENGFLNWYSGKMWLDRAVNKIIEGNFKFEMPPNRLRKFVFRDDIGLTTLDKQRIAGSLTSGGGTNSGRKAKTTASDVYEAMMLVDDEGRKVTVKAIAEYLKIHIRTVNRKFKENKDLKEAKIVLNEAYKRSKTR